MTPFERAGYLAQARSSVFQRRVQEAQANIQMMFAVCGNPYVAFSGGKDSAVLLHLVLSVSEPPVITRTLTSGETRLLHGNWDAVFAAWKLRHQERLVMEEVLIDRVFSEEWKHADFHTQRKAGKGDIITALPGTHDGVFLGLRSEESKARRMANRKGALRQYVPTRKDALAGQWSCNPLAWWKTRDVAAYVVLHDLPMLSEYERSGFDARTTARLTGDSLRQNGFQALRLRDPAGYNRLMVRFPELSWWNG